MSHPKAELGALPHADGSVNYSWQGFEVAGSVNGPIEVQRRDEIPEEAFIEVNVRPANGTGGTHLRLYLLRSTRSDNNLGTRERHLEVLITSVLRSIILTKLHPRTLIQITLQLLTTPENGSISAPVSQYASHLPALPHLLHAALLALLNANIPLSRTYTVALIGTDDDGKTIAWPNSKVMESLAAVHVVALSSKGETLLLESEGDFSVEDFRNIAAMARTLCLDAGDDKSEMQVDTAMPLQTWLRGLLEQQIKTANQWRDYL